MLTAHARVPQTLATIARLKACDPAPAEILVHVDDNQTACADAVRRAFPDVRVILSQRRVGPGGARNALVAAAVHSVVASFDDDSYPMDADYFGRLVALFSAFPSAAVVTARIFHINDPVEPPRAVADWGADFSGGACAYRRQRYLDVGGYVPLPDAYNMEEVDFALRLHGQGGKVLGTPWLRVFHDTDLARHADPVVTSASISNLALLTFLRYPMSLWPVGVGQVLKRISWLWWNGRRRGVAHGLASIPQRLWAYRAYRQPVSHTVLRSYLALRRQPVSAEFAP
jgi:GT2 family glycosyltransferase